MEDESNVSRSGSNSRMFACNTVPPGLFMASFGTNVQSKDLENVLLLVIYSSLDFPKLITPRSTYIHSLAKALMTRTWTIPGNKLGSQCILQIHSKQSCSWKVLQIHWTGICNASYFFRKYTLCCAFYYLGGQGGILQGMAPVAGRLLWSHKDISTCTWKSL